MKLFYRELGEGKPVIILHGLLGTCDNWLTLSKKMADNYHLFLIDQRNHGQSEWSDEWNYEVMAEDLKNFIQTHNIEKPIVVGHSMGGKTAMLFACKFPELLEKLVVVDIAPKQYPVHHQKIIEGLRSIDIDNITTRKEADQQLAVHIDELGVRQFLLKNLFRNTNKKFVWRMNLSVIERDISNVGQVLSDAYTFEKETLFIRGAKSKYIKDEDFDLINKHFKNASIETVAGAGHWVHAEKPQEMLELFQAFFQ